VVSATQHLNAEGFELELSASKVESDNAAESGAILSESQPAMGGIAGGDASNPPSSASAAGTRDCKLEITIGHSAFALELVLRVCAPGVDPESELLQDPATEWESASLLVLQESSYCGAGVAHTAGASKGAVAGAACGDEKEDKVDNEDEDEDDDDDGVLSADHLDQGALAAARSGNTADLVATLRRELQRHAVATAVSAPAPGSSNSSNSTLPLLPHVDEGLLELGAAKETSGNTKGGRQPVRLFSPDGVKVRAARAHAADVLRSSAICLTEGALLASGEAETSFLLGRDGSGTENETESSWDLEHGTVFTRVGYRGADSDSAALADAAKESEELLERSASPSCGVVAYGHRPGGIGAALQLRDAVATTASIARLALAGIGAAVATGDAAVATGLPCPGLIRMTQIAIQGQGHGHAGGLGGWIRCRHRVLFPGPTNGDGGDHATLVETLAWAGALHDGAGSRRAEGTTPPAKRARAEGALHGGAE